MARLNIEDSLYTEKPWLKLVKKTSNHYEALGLIVSAFTLAQKCWLKHGRIPADKWDPDFEVLIEVELAERDVNDRSVYIKGSKEQFSWLTQKSEAGSKTSDKKLKQLADARSKRWESSERTLNGLRTGLNGSEPLSLSLPPSPDDSKESSASDASEKNEFKPVVNNSAVSNFDARFAPDREKWDAVLDEFGIQKRVSRHLGAIRNTFDGPEALRDFINLKAESDTCKAIVKDSGGDLAKARPRVEQFVLVCLKREIGVIQ